MEELRLLFNDLLSATNMQFVRYLHDRLPWDDRMMAVVGPRGVGKTTMLLQHIKQYLNPQKTLYVKADDLYFTTHRLFDTANEFFKYGGRHFYIDEIHKYPNWSQELKMMYDYLPRLQVVFTGSSILDIYRGQADLSRRVLAYHLDGLSFREFICMKENVQLPACSLKDILQHKVSTGGRQPLPLFKEYLQTGYYPFFMDTGYNKRLQSIINLILEVDVPLHANMNVGSVRKLKQLLYIIAQSVPFKPNMTKLAALTDTHRNMLSDYFYYLEKAGLILQLRTGANGVNALGKVEKLYLNNTDLLYALAEDKPNKGNIRETFFFNQMQVNNAVTSAEKGDFTIGKYTFEVGGEGKTQRQVLGVKDAFIVKDDIEYGAGNILPLWSFGFNY